MELDSKFWALHPADQIALLEDEQERVLERCERDEEYHNSLTDDQKYYYTNLAQDICYGRHHHMYVEEQDKEPTTVLTTRELAKRLRVSVNHLHNLRIDGTFEPGTHWILKGRTLKSGILWSYEAVYERLTEMAAEALLEETK